jgi:DNA-directed RNA polymerase specialized sigma24 family protein
MKNETVMSMQLSKSTIANLSDMQGGTVRSWSSLALHALKQQTQQKAEMIK